MSHIEEAIRMWEMYRQGTIGELANVPEEQWDHRAGEGARTVRELAMHIAISAIGFTNELVSPAPSFTKLRDPATQEKMAEPYALKTSKADLLELLQTSGEDNARRLREAGDTLEAKTMPSFGGEGSCLSGLWFAAAHEMYHRGQIATYARQLGLVPAMTQLTQKGTIPPRR